MSDSLLAMMRETMEKAVARGAVATSLWAVSPRVRNVLSRRFLAFRKGWPAKPRYRRSVHRAYRTLGVFP